MLYITLTVVQIMMECELGSLKKLMNDVNQSLNEAQISIVCRNVLMGLNFLHRNNIVHRDIKCANVLFNTEGEIKLADFGISQQLTEELPHLRGLAGYVHHQYVLVLDVNIILEHWRGWPLKFTADPTTTLKLTCGHSA